MPVPCAILARAGRFVRRVTRLCVRGRAKRDFGPGYFEFVAALCVRSVRYVVALRRRLTVGVAAMRVRKWRHVFAGAGKQ